MTSYISDESYEMYDELVNKNVPFRVPKVKRWLNCFHIISTLSDVALTKNTKVELTKSGALEG
jgi:hypothetical protein